MLAGTLEPDSGRVTRRGGVTVGVLDQADTLDDARTVARRRSSATRPSTSGPATPQVRDVIAGLRRRHPVGAAVGELSGGQRRRVALAALLVGD